MKNEGIMRSYK